jgi:hypothetical protein
MTDQIKIAQTPAEKQFLWMIRDLVAQGCIDWQNDEGPWDGPIPVFSQFVARYAEAIALLAEYGLVTDLTDNGGRVVSGKLLSLIDTAKTLQTGVFNPRPEEAFQTAPEIGDHI